MSKVKPEDLICEWCSNHPYLCECEDTDNKYHFILKEDQ